jgi:superfamily I DNA/RNA helicase
MVFSKPAGTRRPAASGDPAEHPVIGANRLNAEQRAAAKSRQRWVMVVAGPGTGKTRVLTHRIARLIRGGESSSEQILAVTFTNKAAENLKEQLRRQIGASPLPQVGTFHSLSLEILREHRPDAPWIVDDAEQRILIADAIHWTGVSLPVRRAARWIERAKQRLQLPGDPKSAPAGADASFQRVYQAYQASLAIQGLCDYEDIIFETVRLLESDRRCRESYRKRFRSIFVDEYQDINASQHRLLQLLAADADVGGQLFVIGDPDQSIYGFRGSDVQFFRSFTKDYPNAAVFELKRNYRTVDTILKASRQVLKSPFTAVRPLSMQTGDGSVTMIESGSETAEAVAIGKTIEQLVGGSGFQAIDFGKVRPESSAVELSFSDIAVLFRTRAQMDVVQTTLIRAGIPCRVIQKTDHYHQPPIAELLALMKLISGGGTYNAVRILPGVFGERISDRDWDCFRKWGLSRGWPAADALNAVHRLPIPHVRASGQRRLCRFAEQVTACRTSVAGLAVDRQLAQLIATTPLGAMIDAHSAAAHRLERIKNNARRSRDIRAFFAGIDMATDADLYDANVQKVSLMTLHAAKGLEFSAVFIAGCEDGFIPHRRDDDSADDRDEEQRLFYVGMTRAKRQLFLTWATHRRVNGRRTTRQRSPFIESIDSRLLSHAASGPVRRQIQLELFSENG